MPLRTTRTLCLCLEPPGPLRRELALFRRRLFAAGGEASALALPELLFLGRIPRPAPGGARISLQALRLLLPELWRPARGEFRSGPLFFEEGLLYLGLEGPLAELRRGAEASLALEPLPLLSDRGFFLLREGGGAGAEPSEPARGKSLELALEAGPPALSFFSAGLLLLELCFAEDPFRAASWRERGRARRLSGPRL